jgi:glycosyltransferase involved in cell wall biosynthesis
MPRKLLFVVNEALFFTTHRMPVALAMRERGFDVHVAAPFEAKPVAKIERAGLRFHPIPLGRGSRNPFRELALIVSMAALFRALKPELVHLVAMKPVLWGGILCRWLGVPAVVHAITGLGFVFGGEGMTARLQRWPIERLYRLALAHANSRTIFQNDDDLALFGANRLVDPDRAALIPGCGVDLAEFKMEPEPLGRPVVLFPARLIAAKGLCEFVEAARLLRGQGVLARFVLAGRNDPENPTDVGEAQIRRWVKDGVIEWIGYSSDMPRTLAGAHIVCLPTKYREGLPRVLIEAAASGRAIVTTDRPGCRAIVKDQINGLLVPAEDPLKLAGALRRLIENPELRQAMGVEGRAIAEAGFSLERFVNSSLDVYRALIPGVSP